MESRDVRGAPPISSESSSARQTTLGGEPALAWTSTASDGYHVNKLATLHGARGYMIFLASPTANDDAQNWRTSVGGGAWAWCSLVGGAAAPGPRGGSRCIAARRTDAGWPCSSALSWGLVGA